MTTPDGSLVVAEVLEVGRRLGLTHAEASISLNLTDGLTPGEIATARAVSIHTVRNQLKSAMAKLDLHRQAELVVLVERTRQGR